MYIVFQYTFMINSGASVDNAMFTCLATTLQYTSLHDNTAFSYFCIGGDNGMDRDDRTEYSVFFIQLFRYIFSDAVVSDTDKYREHSFWIVGKNMIFHPFLYVGIIIYDARQFSAVFFQYIHDHFGVSAGSV